MVTRTWHGANSTEVFGVLDDIFCSDAVWMEFVTFIDMFV